MNADSEPMPSPPTEVHTCLNCGSIINSNYCPDCGQHSASHNHGLWQFLQEFLEEFIRFDSKLLRTIVPLITKPGFLTKEWVEGKRVRYITPLKLYVTLSAIFFLVISIKTTYFTPKEFGNGVKISRTVTPKTANSSYSVLDNLLEQKLGDAKKIDSVAISKEIMGHLPTANFIIMPIVAGIFHLLYLRRKRFYVEHLVFTLHYFSFSFLALTFATIIPFDILTLVALLWIIGYLPVAMVRNYGQSWGKTLVKWVIYEMIYFWVIVAALLLTFVATLLAMPDLKRPLDAKPAGIGAASLASNNPSAPSRK